MKNKIKYIINLIVIMLISIISFYAGLNFYHPYDANRDRQVDIRDLLVTQKYLIEKKESNK